MKKPKGYFLQLHGPDDAEEIIAELDADDAGYLCQRLPDGSARVLTDRLMAPGQMLLLENNEAAEQVEAMLQAGGEWGGDWTTEEGRQAESIDDDEEDDDAGDDAEISAGFPRVTHLATPPTILAQAAAPPARFHKCGQCGALNAYTY